MAERLFKFRGTGCWPASVTRKHMRTMAVERPRQRSISTSWFEISDSIPCRQTLPLAFAFGVHSGLVLLADGDDLHGRLDLLGNTVNVASRLSDVAQSDEIMVSKETLGAESHFYETAPSRSLSLQGIIHPIAVYGILGRAAVGTRFEAGSMRGLTSFVGRQTEFQALKGSLYDVIRDKPQYVAVVGPLRHGKDPTRRRISSRLGKFRLPDTARLLRKLSER